ncbi:Ger(x)C family spore germination protein [Cohnella sp. JJ-181]|uniref:Ger(x)C family spore germination protein n=1 Tax=Cohnella rhizoplanae TaxID=2974897 RepID=UPI0022FF6C14|nr:Ger(x)C family spore germination protein [Cohnella sp. JJ-181]CAI6047760.1 Spore germination protein B3 [Cohnella sp. JJ-181]
MAKRCRLLALVGAMAMACVMTGCWDRVEINNRGFVTGISIDAPTGSGEGEAASVSGLTASFYRICYQIVVPGGQSGGSEGSAGGTSFSNLCGEAVSLAAFHQFATDKLSRSPFYDHLKVILISHRVAREGDGLADALDFFLRGSGIRRSIKILIAKGNAAEALNAESPNERLPTSDIESIASNRNSLEKPPASRIGYIHERLMNETSYVVQVLETAHKSVQVSGSAVIDGKTNREAGTLDERQTAGRNFLYGSKMRGSITFKCQGERVSLSVYETKSSMRADVRDPAHIVFGVNVRSVVTVREITGSLDLSKPAVIKKIQACAESEIESTIEDAVSVVQRDIRKDALGLDEYLQQRHYRTWKKIANDWDHGKYLLSGCIVKPRVSVNVRQAGIVDKSER